MTAYADSVTAVSALTPGQLVRSVSTRTGFVRVYDPTLGGTATRSSANLPSVIAVTPKSQYDDAAPWYSQGTLTNGADTGTAKAGAVFIQLAPAAADVANASSVQSFWVDPSAVIVTSVGND